MSGQRYHTVAIVLHWAIAALILSQFPLGWWMTDALQDRSAPQIVIFKAYQIHKSIGLTVLIASFLRLFWRLAHPAPPLPKAMPAWERNAAHASHILLYGLILGLPLTGWAMVSASVYGLPTYWFGLIEWPHLPILSTLADKKPVEDAFKEIHETLGYLAVALIALHVSAALKHHFRDRDDVLTRMIPWLRMR